MSLSHAILGFLQYMPWTGYDLKTIAFDQSVAHFWPAVQQQIYRDLEAMEARGWVTSDIEVQDSKPNRRVYSITEAGRSEFARWLQTFQPLPPHREAFLIQLFFAAQLNDDEIIGLLEGQLQAHQQHLEAMRALRAHVEAEEMTSRQRVLTGFTLDLGARLQETYIEWLRDCIATVKTGHS